MARAREEEWREAKRLCRLSAEEVRMARELGLNPRKLVKNRPSPSQRWKLPIREWVRELYFKRKGGPDPLERRLARPRRVEDVPADLPEGEPEDDSWLDPETISRGEIEEEDRLLRRRQEELRAAAEYVAVAFARLDTVQKVVLFGSVARPLERELPRFARFRREGVLLWHECKDVDLAVWVGDMSDLEALQRARARALNDLLEDADLGVAHHRVDVFLLEPASDRYLGRLCSFGVCPKGKPECRVPGCGRALFLRQHEGFAFDPRALDPEATRVLFDRARQLGPPSVDRWWDIPF